MVEMRLSIEQRNQLKAMGFLYAVVIAKDVSVCIPGSVDSVFSRRPDAASEVSRLNRTYEFIAPDAYELQEL